MAKIHDISLTMTTRMPVWPGGPKPVLDRVMTIGEDGAPCNVTQLNFGAHTGTHLDAPLHFIKDGNGVEKLDLDVLVGPALLLEVGDDVDMVTRETFEGLDIPQGTGRLLIRSRNSAIWAGDQRPGALAQKPGKRVPCRRPTNKRCPRVSGRGRWLRCRR